MDNIDDSLTLLAKKPMTAELQTRIDALTRDKAALVCMHLGAGAAALGLPCMSVPGCRALGGY
jgi:hypothetical protein